MQEVWKAAPHTCAPPHVQCARVVPPVLLNAGGVGRCSHPVHTSVRPHFHPFYVDVPRTST
eukprot:191487-Chlamydomonas_euryale.AAC.1